MRSSCFPAKNWVRFVILQPICPADRISTMIVSHIRLTHNVDRSRLDGMGPGPKGCRRDQGDDPFDLPQGVLIPAAVKLPMVNSADRDREAVADLRVRPETSGRIAEFS